jgi:cutinase
LTHRAIEGLNSTVKNKIAGVVTFGDTQTLQDGGQIPGFDVNKTLIICNVGDVVCSGTLIVLPVHLDYVKWVPTALAWLIGTLITANKTEPWWNGTFLTPSPTPPTTPLYLRPSNAASRATLDPTIPPSLSTALDPLVIESGEPRSYTSPSWTTTLLIMAATVFSTLLCQTLH